MISKEFTFIDLFCGVGGFHLVMQGIGGKCAFASEIDKYAKTTYEAWHGMVPDGDITAIKPSDIPDHDVLCAGFPCFVPGTLILTEYGYIPIEDVNVGDLVLTHLGRWRPVTALMTKDNAPLRRVKSGAGVDLITTDEHPFYIRPRVRYYDKNAHGKRQQYRRFDQPDWKDAQHLTRDHFTGQVIPKPSSDQNSLEFWWVVGRYLADGWRVKRNDRPDGSGRVVICADHGYRAERLEERLRVAGFNPTPSPERTVVKFHITSNEFYNFLEQFGSLAHGKRIPRIALELDIDKSFALLDGYLSGDGGNYNNAVGNGSFQCSTSVSKPLLLGMSLIAQRCRGVVCSITYCKREKKKIIEGREVNQRDTYALSIPERNRVGFVDGDYAWTQVKYSSPAGRGTVLNISVEEDESYVASGAIVHNCQPFSISGVSKNNSLGRAHGFEDKTRGTLFFHVANIMRVKQPRGAIIENVKNLMSHDGGNTWKIIKETLEEVGYNVYQKILDAQDYGVPQHRERTCIICIRSDVDTSTFQFPNPPDIPKATIRSILEPNVDQKYYKSDVAWASMVAYKAKHTAQGNGYGYQMPKLDGIGATLLQRYYKDGSEVVIDTEGNGNPRRFTPREAMRYMGYPDHLPIVVSDTQMYRQMGNSIVPSMFQEVSAMLVGSVIGS